MKLFIKYQISRKRPIRSIKSSNLQFLRKSYAIKLRKLNFITEGKMKKGGVLEAAQQDHRLHKADGHFYLEALSTDLGKGKIKTTWRVDSLYDFEPFTKATYYTNIPLDGKNLKLPDGLSHYMTKIGVAEAFWYRAEWTETWMVK